VDVTKITSALIDKDQDSAVDLVTLRIIHYHVFGKFESN